MAAKQPFRAAFVFGKLPGDRETTVAFMRDHGVLPARKLCSRHRKPMNLVRSTEGVAGYFRCGKCGFQAAVSRGTFFEDSRLPITVILRLMYAFSNDWTRAQVRKEIQSYSLQPDQDFSSATLCAWFKFCRELVVDYFSTLQGNAPKIGGPGSVVQVDESSFGPRGYERGRVLQGHWVLGMIQDGSDEIRMVVVDSRDAATLIPIIRQHVEVGTEIHTDEWAAYQGLANDGYIHRTVNHNDIEHRFVAPDGTNTQRIQASWRPAKDWLRRRHCPSGQFADYLCEYLWRRYCNKEGIDPFESLLEAVRFRYGDFRN